MAYSNKVIDHYNNPRNVGSMDKSDPNVGTGVVGAPACVHGLAVRRNRDARDDCDHIVANGRDERLYRVPADCGGEVDDRVGEKSAEQDRAAQVAVRQ